MSESPAIYANPVWRFSPSAYNLVFGRGCSCGYMAASHPSEPETFFGIPIQRDELLQENQVVLESAMYVISFALSPDDNSVYRTGKLIPQFAEEARFSRS